MASPKDSFYEKVEKGRQERLLKENPELFGEGDGRYKNGTNYPHVLQDGANNFYEKISERYSKGRFNLGYVSIFRGAEDIGMHSPTNTVSSQVACLNHLFPIRDDKKAVEAIIKGLKINIKGESIEFDEVLPINGTNGNAGTDGLYIDFEVRDPNNLLDENKGGVGCTRIDALVRAKDNNDKKWIIVFEWKYTESFTTPNDRSIEDKKKNNTVPKAEKGKERWGIERMQKYNKLIQISQSLISLCKETRDNNAYAREYRNKVYYHEPYYELMRQTLWAELVIGRIVNKDKKKKGEEFLEDASDYLHICVVPNANKPLLDTGFNGVGNTMEETWRNCLTDDGSERFKIIDPEDLFKPLRDGEIFPDFEGHLNYLEKRYWGNEFAEYFNTVFHKTVGMLSSRSDDLKDIYKRYAEVVEARKCDDKYLKDGEKIEAAIKKCGVGSVLQLYNSISRLELESLQYDVRFCGQHICFVNVSGAKPEIYFEKNKNVDDIENNKKYFGIEEVKMKNVVSLADAEEFFRCFKTAPAGNVKSPELKLQALIRGEMDKKDSVLFENIEPVKVGAGFFEMPSAVNASTLVPEISEKKNGTIAFGYIDILARVSCPNGGWMPAVIEVKDENDPEKPVEAVMTQALIYATFLGHLLANKDCGEAWYNIIGGKGVDEKCSVPDTIDILVVAMMPPKKNGKIDEIDAPKIRFEVEGKTIILSPCTCYVNTLPAINSVEWSCFKKNG